MRLVRTALLWAVIFTSQGLAFVDKISRSSLGCRTAYYMLTNSIPRSCNTALDHISLANATQEIESGDMCTSYCLTPLKQAALECEAIEMVYTAISRRCCRNRQGQQCFSLSGHASLEELVSECGPITNQTTTGSCSPACTAAMSGAAGALGCCLPALLTGSSQHQPLLEPTFWQHCHADGPGEFCTQCSKGTLPNSGQTILILTVAAMFGTLHC